MNEKKIIVTGEDGKEYVVSSNQLKPISEKKAKGKFDSRDKRAVRVAEQFKKVIGKVGTAMMNFADKINAGFDKSLANEAYHKESDYNKSFDKIEQEIESAGGVTSREKVDIPKENQEPIVKPPINQNTVKLPNQEEVPTKKVEIQNGQPVTIEKKDGYTIIDRRNPKIVEAGKKAKEVNGNNSFDTDVLEKNINETMKKLEDEIANLSKQVFNYTEGLKEQNSNYNNLEEEIETLRKDNENLKREKEESNAKVSDLEQENQKMNNQISEMQSFLEQMSKIGNLADAYKTKIFGASSLKKEVKEEQKNVLSQSNPDGGRAYIKQ